LAIHLGCRTEYIQTPASAGKIYNGLVQAASSDNYDHLTVVVAYATKIGCELLVDGFASHCSSWKDIKKRWLISIDDGITEPNALSYLAKLPNSTVRIPNADVLLKKGLKPAFHFHSKFYVFERSDNPKKIALFSGSSNLTQSGLFFNNEQATSFILAPPISEQEKQFLVDLTKQKKIIERIFKSSSPLDEEFLNKYRLLWHQANLPKVERKSYGNVLQPNPVFNLPKAIALATADAFWVKVTNKVVPNLGKDKPGNQIDLQRGSRVFFGFGIGGVPPNTVFGSVPISFEGVTSNHSVRFGNNYMDKINLPILQPPRSYAAKALLFKRKRTGVFDLKIGNLYQEKKWKKMSEEQGTLFRMQSGRPYGVFS
jgi:HKD family nuclease